MKQLPVYANTERIALFIPYFAHHITQHLVQARTSQAHTSVSAQQIMSDVNSILTDSAATARKI